jgi:hypothetical protein
MKTRLKIRNEKLLNHDDDDDDSNNTGRLKAKIENLDKERSKKQQKDNYNINLNENLIEIYDEDSLDGIECNNNSNNKSNPLFWSTADICRYLKNNDLSDNLIIQLIWENVSSFIIVPRRQIKTFF